MSSTTDPFAVRDGEELLPFDPATTADDARLVFIGRIRSPWLKREDCPKNLRQARERGQSATVEIDPPWRRGLRGLEGTSHLILLYWMDRARRDLIVQRPRNTPEPLGVFSLRSPVRPNPIGLGVAGLLRLDAPSGRLTIDAIDCLDGTPLIDVKPYYASTDAFADAVNG